MKTSLMTLVLASAIGVSTAAASPTSREFAQRQHVTTPVQTAAVSMTPQEGARQERSYAQREAQSTDLEAFEGGRMLLFLVGVALLVILILVLI